MMTSLSSSLAVEEDKEEELNRIESQGGKRYHLPTYHCYDLLPSCKKEVGLGWPRAFPSRHRYRSHICPVAACTSCATTGPNGTWSPLEPHKPLSFSETCSGLAGLAEA